MTFVLTHAKKDLRKPQTSQKWTTSLISVAPCFSCGFLQNDSLKLTRPDKHPPPPLPFPTSWFQQRLRLPPRLSSQSRLIRSDFVHINCRSLQHLGASGRGKSTAKNESGRQERQVDNLRSIVQCMEEEKSPRDVVVKSDFILFFLKWSLYWHCREKAKSNFSDLIYFLLLRKQQESDNVFTGKELVWWNHPLIT